MKTSSAQEIFFGWVSEEILRLEISLIVRICIALVGPMPLICWSSFREQLKSSFRPCSLIKRLDISITFSLGLPVLSNIANSSESVSISGPCFRNFSRGWESFGRSLIFMEEIGEGDINILS